jgi:hypothetical protein
MALEAITFRTCVHLDIVQSGTYDGYRFLLGISDLFLEVAYSQHNRVY